MYKLTNYTFKVYNLISFDLRNHCKQDSEHFCHPQKCFSVVLPTCFFGGREEEDEICEQNSCNWYEIAFQKLYLNLFYIKN